MDNPHYADIIMGDARMTIGKRSDSKADQRIPALSRGLRALGALASAGEGGLSFSELGRLLGELPAPTLSRLLKALLAEGHVVKTPAGLYARGPEIEALGRALGAGGTIEELSLEAMNAFSCETGESIAFARFYGERLVLVEKVEVADSFKLAPRGQVFRPAAWEGPAVVVAAHLAGADFNKFTRSPESRIESMAEFRRLGSTYRKNGAHIEPLPGRPSRGGPRRACVAVLDSEGRPVGELHTVCPASRFGDDDGKIVARLSAAAGQMSARLAAGNSGD